MLINIAIALIISANIFHIITILETLINEKQIFMNALLIIIAVISSHCWVKLMKLN